MKKIQISNTELQITGGAPATLQDNPTEMLIAQWIKECEVSPLTQKNYRAGIKVFTGWLEVNGELTEEGLISYRAWLKVNRATSSAKKYFGLAKNFVGWLSKRGYLERNIAHDVKGVKLDDDQHSRDAVSPEEIAAALNQFDTSTLKGKRDKAIFALLAGCGLRTIEVSRLNVGSIEFRRGNWTLKIWGKGKSGATDVVVLSPEVKELIDIYLAARGKAGDSEPLFVSTSNENRGQRLQTQSISRLCKRAFKAVGIVSKRIVAHSLRHSNATIALEAGAELEDVSMNLRHRSTATTQIYRHDNRALHNPTNLIVSKIIFGALTALTTKGAVTIGG